jgi:hypothetical protein
MNSDEDFDSTEFDSTDTDTGTVDDDSRADAGASSLADSRATRSSEMTVHSDGETARHRGVNKDVKNQRKLRNRSEREGAAMYNEKHHRHNAWPRDIRWIFENKSWTADRYTPWQWALLNVQFRVLDCGCETESSMRYITARTGMVNRSHKVFDALVLAGRVTYELYYEWRPAHARWTQRKLAIARGEKPPPLSEEDSKILAKHSRGKKKGRRGVQLFPVDDPAYEAMYRAIRFSELSDTQRRQTGTDESGYGGASP